MIIVPIMKPIKRFLKLSIFAPVETVVFTTVVLAVDDSLMWFIFKQLIVQMDKNKK